jgi:hypothetical protein
MEDSLGSIPFLVVINGEPDVLDRTLEDLEAAAGHPSRPKRGVHYRIRKAPLTDGALACGVTGRTRWWRWGQPLRYRGTDGYECECDKGQQKNEQTASDAEQFHGGFLSYGLSRTPLVTIGGGLLLDCQKQLTKCEYTLTF